MSDTTHAGPDRREITRLLAEMQAGNKAAHDRVFEMVVGDLHRIAAALMGHERVGHTLQPTALVNEAYFKLVQQKAPWRGRAQFYGIASTIMRRALKDHAKARGAKKRGGDLKRSSLDVLLDRVEEAARAPYSLLDQAFERLEHAAPDLAAVFEQEFFLGRTTEEIALDLGLPLSEVQARSDTARGFIEKVLREMRPGQGGESHDDGSDTQPRD